MGQHRSVHQPTWSVERSLEPCENRVMSGANLSVENVSWAPNKQDRPVLHPISFHVPAGQVLGIVGPNGAGKSTLLRTLYRFQAPLSGQVLIGGQDIWAMPARLAARKVAAVLQEHTPIFGLSVREVVNLGRTPHNIPFGGNRTRDQEVVEMALTQLNLLDLAHRDMATLSGGERQRVTVARALAQEPEVLVLDEPTNHLDIRHQLEVLALIRDLDLTIVVSLHDLNMAADISDMVLLLENGHQRGFGLPEQVLTETLVSGAFGVNARRERLSLSDSNHFSFHLPN